MSEQDKILESMFSRISTLETVLMLFWNEQPNREALKSSAKHILEIRDAIDLNSPSSDLSIAIRDQARKQTFDAIFHELLPEKDRVELRTLESPRSNTSGS